MISESDSIGSEHSKKILSEADRKSEHDSCNITASTISSNLLEKSVLTDNNCYKNRTKYILGIVALFLVVFLWVLSSFVMSLLLRIYPKPFFSTYFSTATFQLYFPILYINSILRSKRNRQKKCETQHLATQKKTPEMQESVVGDQQANQNRQNESSSSAIVQTVPLPKMTNKEILQHSVLFFGIYFVSCFLANLSFEYTDVVSASILLSTSCFFTLIFSIIAGLESFTLMKALSVIICAGGLCIVGLLSYIYDELGQQSHPPVNMALGNLYAIASALLYGLYSVMLKKKTIDESRLNMPFFFGCVGLLSTILLWPFFFILHIFQLEIIELPSLFSMGLLFANNLFGSLAANYCWIYALVNTSPLIVSIGLAFSIPLTILLDALIYKNSMFTFRSLAGVFIVLGFLLLNFSAIFPRFDTFFERSIHYAQKHNQKSTK